MCFAPRVEIPPVKRPQPVRDPMASLVQNARVAALRARGAMGAVATSPLGDSDFGTNVRPARLLGGTAAQA